MTQSDDDLAGRRKYFIYFGIAAGFLISIWYLYRLHLQKTMPGIPVKTDPVWAQFVNVALIFFAAIFQCSLLHKLYALVVRFMRRKRQG
jgi:hypothetical protein